MLGGGTRPPPKAPADVWRGQLRGNSKRGSGTDQNRNYRRFLMLPARLTADPSYMAALHMAGLRVKRVRGCELSDANAGRRRISRPGSDGNFWTRLTTTRDSARVIRI